ncbi:peptide deformylase [Devriesea agamarum]|uniref:peptide deformylase n=1 Tax=Devriesea agamarum TaxID=472569 RepID=UPI00071E161F|nr:peptide deformylase [Devriesea agamarum]
MKLVALVERILARRSGSDDPLPIVQTGHPALRRRAQTWNGQLPAALLDELIDAMVITMRDAPGVGLAAPQVGIPLRLAVLEDTFEPEADDNLLRRTPLDLQVVLNPEYRARGTRCAYAWEGCLSVAGFSSIVPRAVQIDWTALHWNSAQATATPASGTWEGWPARIFQHETDHLAGALCHDLAVPRSTIMNRYVHRYRDLSQAVRQLGLYGDITRLEPGQVELG